MMAGDHGGRPLGGGAQEEEMISRALVVASVLSVLALGAGAAGAQTAFEPPRLPDGKPDLQGV